VPHHRGAFSVNMLSLAAMIIELFGIFAFLVVDYGKSSRKTETLHWCKHFFEIDHFCSSLVLLNVIESVAAAQKDVSIEQTTANA